MKHTGKPRPDLNSLYEGIINGDRIILGQGISIVESKLHSDRDLASRLMERILPYTGKSWRIGITGVPGVGKSTFIEAISKYIVNSSHKVAVLSIDPTSPLTKGSILGDKTRMEKLSKHPMAFVRPSASADHSGGVARNTRESMLLCEAAGFDIVIIETVGVGQSEFDVKNMVDFFLLLMLSGAGDELQGMKKGIMELADALVITKADGENIMTATQAAAMYQQALHLFQARRSDWEPVVLTTSSLTGSGIDKIWETITRFFTNESSKRSISDNRKKQQIAWFHHAFHELMNMDINSTGSLQELQGKLNQLVSDSVLSPRQAAEQLLHAYHEAIRTGR